MNLKKGNEYVFKRGNKIVAVDMALGADTSCAVLARRNTDGSIEVLDIRYADKEQGKCII
tara:strand:+ start:69 stop:248 length:180 start_codon:yes stop_codon:yes gene_type:complete